MRTWNPLRVIAERFTHNALPRWLQRRITMTAFWHQHLEYITLTYRFLGIRFFEETIK